MNTTHCDIYRFEERDIDLLIAEELRVNAAFAKWFVHQATPAAKLTGPAQRTRVSVVEDGSESDVIACFSEKSGGTHWVFIEEKITARMMPDQMERYLRRAEAALHRSEITSFAVVFFAPRISGMPNYLRIDFKGHLGEVDLVFKNLPVAVLTAHIALLDAPGRPIENEKSSALRISGLTPFVIADGMDIIETHVHTAYAAAATLLNFWSGHRDVFDKLFMRID